MYNHAYTVLFNKVANPPSGIPIELTEELYVPSVLTPVKQSLVIGAEIVDHDQFAVQCLKIVDGSTFRLNVQGIDERVTYDIQQLEVDVISFNPFMYLWLALPPDTIQALLVERIYLNAYRGDITQEAVAALILSYIDRISEINA